MLLTLAAWIYISLIAFAWGSIFLRLINGKNLPASNQHFAITCFTGLALIGIFVQWLSIGTGLGSAWVQLLLVSPAGYYFLRDFKWIEFQIAYREWRRNLNVLTTTLAALTILMILSVSVYEISHPDTLAYHEQLIKWAELYRAVPGIVHLDYHYGFQSSWFLLCATFSFSFLGINALTFINTTILIWLVIFLCDQIDKSWKKSALPNQAIGWFLLFALCTGVYQFVLLTSSSASPDFPAAIFILLVFYHSLQSERDRNWPVIVILCFFASTIKLSVAPILLMVLAIAGKPNWKKLAFLSLAFLLAIVPFLLRNYISSGHILFPTAVGSTYLHPDWMYDSTKLKEIGRFILAFARMHTEESQTNASLNVSIADWIPVWWHERSIPNKILLLLQPLALVVLLSNAGRIMKGSRALWSALIVCLVGIIFWFLKGPDPRFGAGFLLVFPALVFFLIASNSQYRQIFSKICMALLLLGCVTIGLYTAFRLTRYFQKDEWLTPEGVIMPRTYYYYDGIKASIPLSGQGSKNITILSADSSALRNFEFRGTNITDGFRARSTSHNP